jgi:peptide deformylase
VPRPGEVGGEAGRLLAVLDDFRARHGFGRAVAAPQIGMALRMVAVRLPGWPTILYNPEITWQSAGTMTLWDDCMCFPDLLVRVRRACSISIGFLDADGRPGERRELDPATSELLQHELDHLDGVLAVDRAEGRDALVARAAFGADPEYFRALVDYRPGTV